MTVVDPRVGRGGHDDARAAAGPRPRWRSVAVPSEHGGWSLTLEPVVLGLVVAWSLPGLALGVVAVLGFMARTPIKIVLVDRWRKRSLDRTRLAGRIAAVELAVIAVLIGFVWVNADGRFWVPLAIALPVLGVELWFDMRSRSRRLLPELAGTVGIGSVAAAIVLADGASATLAAGLWCVVAARSVASIPFVRLQLRRAKEQPHHLWHSDVAQGAAIIAVAAAWGSGWIPFAPLLAIGGLAALQLAGIRRPPQPAVVIGVQQTIFGVAVVAATAAGVLG